jgi:hypothetical protein
LGSRKEQISRCSLLINENIMISSVESWLFHIQF